MARKAGSAEEGKPLGAATDGSDEIVVIGTPGKRVRKARGRWLPPVLGFALRFMFYAVVFCAVSLIGVLLWLMDRPLAAPPWVEARIETHLATQAPDTVIRFGAMVLTVQRGWRPMVELRDVRFEDTNGTPLLAVSDLQATLAMRPLMDGLVQPRTVAMSGLFATVRRGADGQISVVTAPEGNNPNLQAATLPELVNQVDGLFLTPELAALSSVDISSVTLRFEDARAGKVWTVDGARLNLRRDAHDLTVTGDLGLLSGGADVATMAANFTSPLGQPDAQFGVTVTEVDAGDIAAFNPAFGWLDALRAPISGSLRGGVDADGVLTPINATLQIGAGVLQPTSDTRPIPFASARTYFEFNPSASTLRFDELSFESAWGRVVAEGQTKLSGLEAGRLDDLVGQVRISTLEFNPAETFDTPRQLGAASLDFRLVPRPFQFDLGRLRIEDEGEALRLKGVLRAAPGGWDLALDGRMGALAPARLLTLWPNHVAPQARAWIDENFSSGMFHDIDLAVRTKPGSKPDSYIGFGFRDATIRYVAEMPPIEAASGRASILKDRFALALETGYVQAPQDGRVDLAGSSFVIPDLTHGPGSPAEVHLRTHSTATALLSVLDSPPLEIMRKAGLDPALAEATAEAQAFLGFPLGKKVTFEEMDLEVTGTLSNVRTDTLVPNRTLASPRLSVQVTTRGEASGVTIAGAGSFDGIPFDGTWRQVFGAGSSTVAAQVALSNETVDTLGIGLPPGTVQGRGQGQLYLTLRQGAVPEFALTSTLDGLTLAIVPLGWVKGPETPGTLEVSGRLGPVPVVERLQLTAPGLDATGAVTIAPGGGLEAARFERVRVGSWLDAPLVLTGRGVGVPPAISVQGGTLDMRGATFGGGGGGGAQSGPLTLALSRLQINDTIALMDMRGDFRLNAGLQGSFSGRVNGSAPVSGQVVPQAGRSAFQIESDDAGAVFASAGFLKQARGGQMRLLLTPVGTAGAFNGALSVTETRVRDAPAMAALFNALSVVGLIEQMGGQGLHFEQVDAAFRLTPDRVTLTQASAVGPSIGLSMDGTYDVNTKQMDMQGVFSPIYLINGVGSIFTRRGEGLIGFNFSLTGPASAPRVQVNPLSALTPSIFREIFRRPPPEVAVEPGESEGAGPRLLRPEPDAAPQAESNAGNR